MVESKMCGRAFRHRYYRLPPREVGYLRFLFEGYDGLAFLRTLDGRQALVEISYAPSREIEATRFLAALEDEIGLTEVPLPPEAADDPL